MRKSCRTWFGSFFIESRKDAPLPAHVAALHGSGRKQSGSKNGRQGFFFFFKDRHEMQTSGHMVRHIKEK
jgi:hypothetical protein